MKDISLWRHEVRRAGWAARIAPLAGLAATLALVAFGAGSGSTRPQLERLLLTGLEAIVPLAVGMAAVTVVARDPSRELHLTLPAAYIATLARRLATVLGGTAVACLLYSALVAAAGWWSGPGPVGSVLVWAPPLLALTGFAVLAAVLTRSVVLTTTAVAFAWLAEQIFAGSLAAHPLGRPILLFWTTRVGTGEHWLANRLGLTAVGIALLLAAALLVRRPERLLTEEES